MTDLDAVTVNPSCNRVVSASGMRGLAVESSCAALQVQQAKRTRACVVQDMTYSRCFSISWTNSCSCSAPRVSLSKTCASLALTWLRSARPHRGRLCCAVLSCCCSSLCDRCSKGEHFSLEKHKQVQCLCHSQFVVFAASLLLPVVLLFVAFPVSRSLRLPGH
jgi:hypothetical protein